MILDAEAGEREKLNSLNVITLVEKTHFCNSFAIFLLERYIQGEIGRYCKTLFATTNEPIDWLQQTFQSLCHLKCSRSLKLHISTLAVHVNVANSKLIQYLINGWIVCPNLDKVSRVVWKKLYNIDPGVHLTRWKLKLRALSFF